MYKKYTIKFVKEDGDYNYVNIIARTFSAALKYAEEHEYGTIDQIDYVTSEKVDIAE